MILAICIAGGGCAATQMRAPTPGPMRSLEDERDRAPAELWWRRGALAVVVPIALTVVVAGGLD